MTATNKPARTKSATAAKPRKARASKKVVQPPKVVGLVSFSEVKQTPAGLDADFATVQPFKVTLGQVSIVQECWNKAMAGISVMPNETGSYNIAFPSNNDTGLRVIAPGDTLVVYDDGSLGAITGMHAADLCVFIVSDAMKTMLEKSINTPEQPQADRIPPSAATLAE